MRKTLPVGSVELVIDQTGATPILSVNDPNGGVLGQRAISAHVYVLLSEAIHAIQEEAEERLPPATGLTVECLLPREDVEGPALGPFPDLILDGPVLRVDQRRPLARYSVRREDWIMGPAAGDAKGQVYSDLVINAHPDVDDSDLPEPVSRIWIHAEDGTAFGPYPWIQFTYWDLRVGPSGKPLASYDHAAGGWRIVDPFMVTDRVDVRLRISVSPPADQ